MLPFKDVRCSFFQLERSSRIAISALLIRQIAIRHLWIWREETRMKRTRLSFRSTPCEISRQDHWPCRRLGEINKNDVEIATFLSNRPVRLIGNSCCTLKIASASFSFSANSRCDNLGSSSGIHSAVPSSGRLPQLNGSCCFVPFGHDVAKTGIVAGTPRRVAKFHGFHHRE